MFLAPKELKSKVIKKKKKACNSEIGGSQECPGGTQRKARYMSEDIYLVALKVRGLLVGRSTGGGRVSNAEGGTVYREARRESREAASRSEQCSPRGECAKRGSSARQGRAY